MKRNALVDVERMVSKFRPLDGDPTLRVILAAVLANRLAAPVRLVVISPEAGDLVALLGAWRFAVVPTTCTARTVRLSQARAKRLLVLPDAYSTLIKAGCDGGAPVRAAVLELGVSLIAAAPKIRPRLYELPVLLYRSETARLDDAERADREHYRVPAAEAVCRFLDAAFADAAEAEGIAIEPDARLRLTSADRLARWAVGSRFDNAEAEIVAFARALAYMAGRRGVTSHELRLALAVALAPITEEQLRILDTLAERGRSALTDLLATRELSEAARVTDFLARMAKRGVITVERLERRPHPRVYVATERLSELVGGMG